MFQKVLITAVISLTATFACQAKELMVWSAGAVKPALEVLLPAFEKSSAISIQVQYAPVGVLMRRLAEGVMCWCSRRMWSKTLKAKAGA